MKKSTRLLLSILVFIGTFFGFYLLLSMAGMMFGASYAQCIGSIGWFMAYFCFGLPITIAVTNEFYDEH
jgi:hypothetical protein